jgi:serine/threonine protein phosphatase PrpC
VRFAVYQVSRRGGREKNEDRMGYCYTRDAAVFALADGMGGHPQGEVASQLALQALATMFQRQARPRLTDPSQFLRQAVMAGHRDLLRYARARALPDTPRTTAVACVLQDEIACWAHCGDSRLYLVRGDQLVARTRDHSYSELQELMLPVTPLGHGFNRNVLFTCLGSPGTPMIDVAGPHRLQPGDRVMLCSDGLWSSVDDGEITAVLAQRQIAEAVPELVERALRAAGAKSDNVTALAVEWEGAEDTEALDVQTQALGEDLFASSIHTAAIGDSSADDLDDDEIERSIREINDAIQRAAPRRP